MKYKRKLEFLRQKQAWWGKTSTRSKGLNYKARKYQNSMIC